MPFWLMQEITQSDWIWDTLLYIGEIIKNWYALAHMNSYVKFKLNFDIY